MKHKNPVVEILEKQNTINAPDGLITTDQALVLVKLGMSTLLHSDMARKVLTIYLEELLEETEISDSQAKAVYEIMKQSSTSTHRDLCNKVLSKYLDKFKDLFPLEPGTVIPMEAAT